MSRYHTLPAEVDWLEHPQMMGSAMPKRRRARKASARSPMGGVMTRVGGVVTLGGRMPRGAKCKKLRKGPSGLRRCKKFDTHPMGGAMRRQKRAPSAWNRFMSEYRLSNPQVPFAELAREAGAQWRQMSAAEKSHY
jgi:hypothetical protein